MLNYIFVPIQQVPGNDEELNDNEETNNDHDESDTDKFDEQVDAGDINNFVSDQFINTTTKQHINRRITLFRPSKILRL